MSLGSPPLRLTAVLYCVAVLVHSIDVRTHGREAVLPLQAHWQPAGRPADVPCLCQHLRWAFPRLYLTCRCSAGTGNQYDPKIDSTIFLNQNLAVREDGTVKCKNLDVDGLSAAADPKLKNADPKYCEKFSPAAATVTVFEDSSSKTSSLLHVPSSAKLVPASDTHPSGYGRPD
jgi:hypothetical protein